jgi:hypothetical protein
MLPAKITVVIPFSLFSTSTFMLASPFYCAAETKDIVRRQEVTWEDKRLEIATSFLHALS